MQSGKDQEKENQLVQSFLFVRQAIGLLGLALPVVLLGSTLFGVKMQTSISGFYYTQMGDVLVGTMCAIGVFLLSYKGYRNRPDERLSDKITARIAGVSAIGIALFPIGLENACGGCYDTGFTFHPSLIHYVFAGIFFASLAVFSIVLFTRCDRTEKHKIVWTRRNRFYVGCGIVIIMAIIALVIYFLQPDKQPSRDSYNYLFLWESVGVFAFAASWLAKGRALQGLGRLFNKLRR